MERERDDQLRTADEVREHEEATDDEVTPGSHRRPRDPNQPIGGSAYAGDILLPPTGDLEDPPPSTGMPGMPPHTVDDDDESA